MPRPYKMRAAAENHTIKITLYTFQRPQKQVEQTRRPGLMPIPESLGVCREVGQMSLTIRRSLIFHHQHFLWHRAAFLV